MEEGFQLFVKIHIANGLSLIPVLYECRMISLPPIHPTPMASPPFLKYATKVGQVINIVFIFLDILFIEAKTVTNLS